MEESKRREMEKKLRAMLISEEQTQHKDEQVTNGLCGARVIRRRKGVPDVAITCSNERWQVHTL
jgi:hypothetical protein